MSAGTFHPYGCRCLSCELRVTLPTQPRPEAHGFGDTADCVCGRNFATVRGLREHITKARATTRPERGQDYRMRTTE